MKTSKEGRARLRDLEGFRPSFYLDTQGHPTIGVGHRITENEAHYFTAVLTEEEGDELLSRDLVRFEDAVNDAIKVPIVQTQFDALVSIAFNIGASAFRSSTFVRRINEDADPQSIIDAIMMWTANPELVERRKKEATLYADSWGALGLLLSLVALVLFCLTLYYL